MWWSGCPDRAAVTAGRTGQTEACRVGSISDKVTGPQGVTRSCAEPILPEQGTCCWCRWVSPCHGRCRRLCAWMGASVWL